MVPRFLPANRYARARGGDRGSLASLCPVASQRGWGSNSQWRTAFRRDYQIGGDFFFNVDGVHDLAYQTSGADRDDLTQQERIELLIHRHFITVDKPHEDLWPYDDVYRMAVRSEGHDVCAGAEFWFSSLSVHREDPIQESRVLAADRAHFLN